MRCASAWYDRRLREAGGVRLVRARADEPYRSVHDLHRRAGLEVSALAGFTEGNAYHPLGFSLRPAYGRSALADTTPPRFAAVDASEAESRSNCRSRWSRGSRLDGTERWWTIIPPGRVADSEPHRVPARRAGAPRCDDCMELKALGERTSEERRGPRAGAPASGLGQAVIFHDARGRGGPLNVIVWPKMMERFRRD